MSAKRSRPQSIEVEGPTTKDAIRLGLEKLGVTKDKVEVRILAEEKKGLFGMEGAKQAKVKLTKKSQQ